MADSVIYFPSIRVPQTEWFVRTLLYWDSVATIVPTECLDDPELLRPYTNGLINQGLLRAIEPDSSIWQVRGYYESFLSLVDSIDLVPEHEDRRALRFVSVHLDKTGYGLASALAERGLAVFKRGLEHDAWFAVEKNTANILMAYLATILGRQQQLDPITDAIDSLSAFTTIPGAGGAIEARLSPIRTELVTDILPAPRDQVEPREIRDFKDRHRVLLTRFRICVEDHVITTAAIEDAQLRARKLQSAKQELEAGVEEITSCMDRSGWRHIGLGSLSAVVAAGVVLADGLVTGGKLTVAGATLGLASAVYSAFEGARTPKELLARPMAYAALAHRELGC